MKFPQFLMSLLCLSEGCDTEEAMIEQSYYDICVGDVLRKFGLTQFVLVRCDYQFTDLLNTAEWDAAKASGHVGISPPGTITIGEPTQETFQIDGCRRLVVSETVIPITYVTYQTHELLYDYDYWGKFKQHHSLYRVMIVDCNGIFWVSCSYAEALKLGAPVSVTGESPGMPFSLTQIPMPGLGENSIHQVWTTQFQINMDEVLCGVKLPGVLPLLNESNLIASS